MSAGFDIEFLDELLDGDREFAEELFTTFSESAEDCLSKGGAALAAGDRETSFRIFHTLKGAAASVGLNDVRDVAKEFETSAKAGELTRCQEMLEKLRGELDRGNTLLRGYLENLS